MRSLSLGLAVAGLTFLCASPLRAQDDDNIDEVFFNTADKVKLNGTWYRGSGGRKSPTVLMVHGWGSNRSKDGWDSLAKQFQGKGYSVLTFDLRGHGKSIELSDKKAFWSLPHNQRYAAPPGGISAARLPLRINYKDFNRAYYPYLLNDLTAARRFLDEKNDATACNVGQTFVIAEKEGATLAMMWLGHEAHPSRNGITAPDAITPAQDLPAITDIAGCVWLSIDSNPLGIGKVLPYYSSPMWAASQNSAGPLLEPIKEKTSMCFMVGKKDSAGYGSTSYWYQKKFYGHTVRKEDRMKYPVVLDTKLRGAELLGQAALETDAIILEFVEKIKERGVGNNWVKRNIDRAAFNPVPLQLLGYTGR